MSKLTSLGEVKDGVQLPAYDPKSHGVGIVHLGLGAFHRAHQALYTDDALAADGGDWRIVAASLRSTSMVDILNAQNGLYSLVVKGEGKPEARIIGSISGAIAASRDREKLLDLLAEETVRIVSITVTEKAYGIYRDGKIIVDDEAIAGDLASPRKPSGVIGIIVEGLRRRHQNGVAPFTVLCCDNLPENGKLIRSGAIDFANHIDADLGRWIADNVAFPSTMIDRITPAPTDSSLLEAKGLIGIDDLAAIETEPFTQWVIEDNFPTGRPRWEAGGAIFVDDVAPYEAMKLRMLNGSHSLIAYAGFLSGCKYVRDAVDYAAFAKIINRHMQAAADTLAPVGEINLSAYQNQLIERFANPAIAHETYQIAMDGTQKLSQRLLEPALHALEQNQQTRSFAFAIAAWMRFCLGEDEAGNTYELRDPRQVKIGHALENIPRQAEAIVNALNNLPSLIPAVLAQDNYWHKTVCEILSSMLENGMRATIEQEAKLI